MNRRDLVWIALVWIVSLSVGTTVAAVLKDDDPTTNDALAAVIAAASFGGTGTGLYVYGRRESWDRRDVLSLAVIWVPLLGAAILATVATGQSYGAGFVIGVVGFVVTGSYLDQSRKRRRAQQAATAQPIRTCPHCGTHMHYEVRICSQCGADSPRWTFDGGVWWTRSATGERQWLDESAGYLRSYRDYEPIDGG
jgi:ribosomal protein L32